MLAVFIITVHSLQQDSLGSQTPPGLKISGFSSWEKKLPGASLGIVSGGWEHSTFHTSGAPSARVVGGNLRHLLIPRHLGVKAFHSLLRVRPDACMVLDLMCVSSAQIKYLCAWGKRDQLHLLV